MSFMVHPSCAISKVNLNPRNNILLLYLSTLQLFGSRWLHVLICLIWSAGSVSVSTFICDCVYPRFSINTTEPVKRQISKTSIQFFINFLLLLETTILLQGFTRSSRLEIWIWTSSKHKRPGKHCPASQVVEAHGLGPKVASIHNGTMVLGGVRALTTRHDDTELLSGGSDGTIIIWDISGGTLGRVLKKIEVSLCTSHFRFQILASHFRFQIWASHFRFQIWACWLYSSNLMQVSRNVVASLFSFLTWPGRIRLTGCSGGLTKACLGDNPPITKSRNNGKRFTSVQCCFETLCTILNPTTAICELVSATNSTTIGIWTAKDMMNLTCRWCFECFSSWSTHGWHLVPNWSHSVHESCLWLAQAMWSAHVGHLVRHYDE